MERIKLIHMRGASIGAYGETTQYNYRSSTENTCDVGHDHIHTYRVRKILVGVSLRGCLEEV